MRTSPLLADFIHHRVCKPICEKLLTLPYAQMVLDGTLEQYLREAAGTHGLDVG